MATEYDEYLFISCAAPNTVNMGVGRKDSRVEKMLQQRDSGQTPSVCSTMTTTSRVTDVTQATQLKSKVMVPATSKVRQSHGAEPPPPRTGSGLNTVDEDGDDKHSRSFSEVDVAATDTFDEEDDFNDGPGAGAGAGAGVGVGVGVNRKGGRAKEDWDTSPIIPIVPPVSIATKVHRGKAARDEEVALFKRQQKQASNAEEDDAENADADSDD